MKAGAGSDHTIRTFLSLVPLLPIVLLLSACPPPVSDLLATAVADKLPPTLTVIEPTVADTYSGTMVFKGTVTDDATSSGDGKGTLASVSYSVSNNVLLKGKIKLNTVGEATADTTFGSGTITWDNATKVFSFQVDTVGITGTLTVQIFAADANGNTTTSSVQLTESVGPVIALSSPTSTKFTKGSTTVVLAGTVANSKTDSASASNIETLTWQVLGMGWSGTLSHVGSASTTLSVNNVGFSASHTYAFTYDPSTRGFSTQFYINSGATSILLVDIIAVDTNGHSTTKQLYLQEDSAGPQLELTTPAVPFYTKNSSAFGTRTINGTITNYATVTALSYSIQNAANSAITTGTIPLSPLPAFDSNGNFHFDIDYSTAPSVWLNGGTVNIFVTATNAKSVDSETFVSLAEDSTLPTVSSISMTSDNAISAARAMQNDTVTLHFTISDAGSGFG
jgi:hypothetical protein